MVSCAAICVRGHLSAVKIWGTLRARNMISSARWRRDSGDMLMMSENVSLPRPTDAHDAGNADDDTPGPCGN